MQRAFANVEKSNYAPKDKQTVASGLFLVAFSAFEAGIADLFLAYSLGHQALDGSQAARHVVPRDRAHALALAKGGNQVLYWSDAGKVIDRSTDWFDTGFKLADGLRTHKNVLDKSRKLRNFAAHRSEEAWQQFRGVWLSDVGPVPMVLPHPGEFLLIRKGRRTTDTFFERYVSELERAFGLSCGAP